MNSQTQNGSSAPKAAGANAPAQPAKAVSKNPLTALGAMSQADLAQRLLEAADEATEEVSQTAAIEESTPETDVESTQEPAAGELPAEGEAGEAEPEGETTPEAEDATDEVAAEAEDETEELQSVTTLTPEQKKHYGKVIAERLREQKEKLAAEHQQALSEQEAALKAKVQELEGELEEARTTRSRQNPADLSQLDTVGAVKQKVEQAEAQLESVTDAIQQLGIDAAGVEQMLLDAKVELPDYEPSTMLRWLKAQGHAAKEVIKAAPRREEQIALRDKTTAALKATFDWYGKPNTKEHQGLIEARRSYPFIASQPNGDALLIALAHGMAVISSKFPDKPAAKAGKPEAPKLTPPVNRRPATAAAPPQPRNGKSPDAHKAEVKLRSGGGTEADLSALLLARGL